MVGLVCGFCSNITVSSMSVQIPVSGEHCLSIIIDQGCSQDTFPDGPWGILVGLREMGATERLN